MLSVKSLPLVVLAALGMVNAQQQCRCQASFEHFYKDRRRQLGRYRYDYQRSYVDVDGNYIVNGVRVLPNSDPACSSSRASNRIWKYIFGNHNRRLSEVDENWTIEELEDIGMGEDFPTKFDDESMLDGFVYDDEEESDFETELDDLDDSIQEVEADAVVERNLRSRYYFFGKGKGKGGSMGMGKGKGGMVRFRLVLWLTLCCTPEFVF